MEERRLMAVIDLAALGAGGTTIFGAEVGDLSGYSVCSAGDFNGDGFDDVVIGAFRADASGNAKSYAGDSYVIFGKASPLATIDLANLGSAGIIIFGSEAGDNSGFSVSSAGDVNGDGFDDVIIGARRADALGNAKSDAGDSHVLFGKASPPATIDLANLGTAGFTIFGTDASDNSGRSVSSAGDVNGDGFDDLVIGARYADASGNAKSNAGESYVLFGAAVLPPTIDLANLGSAGITIFGAETYDFSGHSVSSAGDVNGDGFDDLVIGAYLAAASGNLRSLAGESYVIFGAVSLPATIDLANFGSLGITIFGAAAGDESGFSVGSAGDVNGDGFDDLVIGAHTADRVYATNTNDGDSYVIFGAASLPATINIMSLGSAGITIVGADSGDLSGNSVSSAGDVNGDGFDDLVIGAYRADASGNAKLQSGDSYVIFGAVSLPPTIDLANLGSAGITIFGADANDLSGNSVSGAGDVNGDGFDDLVIGAFSADASGNAKSNAGESYVIFGGNAFTNSVTHLGTEVGETLTGNPLSNIMVGGRGNDTLIGEFGADVLIGGQGNDLLRKSDLSFKRIDGGSGEDTLRLDVSGVTLDLTTLRDNRLLGIETIDITGNGNNILRLNRRDVLNISDQTNTLDVRGNAGDLLNIELGWTQFTNLVIGAETFQIFRNGSAMLRVLVGVTVKVKTVDLSDFGAAGTTLFGANANDGSGHSVSNAGDVNGDGFDDLIIGAWLADASENFKLNAGDSYLIFGAASLPTTIDLGNLGSAGMTIFGADGNDSSGSSVSSAGDVNQDGFDDLIIGAYGADASGNLKPLAGESYVIFGAASLPATIDLANLSALGPTVGITIFGADGLDSSGRSVSSAGDVNGDGFDDLVIGAFAADASGNAKSAAGESYVIFGAASFPATIDLATLGSAGITIFGAETGDRSGLSLSSAGDVNGDGFDDLIIGANRANSSGDIRTYAGESYVIFGAASLPATIDLANLSALGPNVGITIFGAERFDYSGISVSSAGDVNGDGFDDLIIGADAADASGNGKSSAGDSYVIFGAVSLPATIDLADYDSAGISIFGAETGDRSGISVSGAGDVNGDGFDDLVIGAFRADASGNTKKDAGESYLIFGASALPTTINLANVGSAGIALFGANIEDDSGGSVSGAGDINGDGFDDLIIAALNADGIGNLESNAGKSYLVFGGNQITLSVTHLGTAISETLTGSAAANIMVAGRGNDIVIGNGGADILLGGQGNDILTVSDLSFKRIVGGTGADTLRLDGTGVTLDLTTIRDNRILSTETIDISGTGNNTLTLNKAEVLNISDSSNTLTVRRNIGDVVNRGAGWVQGANQSFSGLTFEVFTQGTARLNVQLVSQSPVIGSIGAAITYNPNSPRVLVFPTATITDPDNVNFANALLTVTNTNGQSTDSLAIIPTATITVSAGNVLFNGTIIGTFTGGVGTTPLAFTFNNQASFARVQLVLNAIGFASSSASPIATSRSVSVQVTDGIGGTSTLQSKLVKINQVPVIGSIGAAATYNPGGPRVLVFPTATITDPDTINFANSVLTVTNTNGQATDSLVIVPTAIITASGANVLFNGTIIGTFSGGAGTTPLAFTFNNQASFARVQLVLNTIGFASSLAVPTTTARTVTARVTDGVGGISALQSKLVNINQIPVIGSIGTAATYNPSGPRVLVFPTATITDPNTVNFANAVLTVTNTNGQATDSLAIIPTATITVSGANVLFNGTIMGTFTGGVGTTPLAFTFNNQASFARVQLVLNTIGFASSLAAPTTTARTISVRVTDGVGGTSTLQSKLVNINQVPVIGSIGAAANYNKVTGVRVSVFSTATITDPDTVNFANAVLTVTNTNGQATDSLAIIPTATITVSGANVLFNGTIMGSFTGGTGTTPLAFTFNNQASFARVQLVLNAVGFASSLPAPITTPRTITVRVTDGLGGTSVLQSKIVNII